MISIVCKYGKTGLSTLDMKIVESLKALEIEIFKNIAPLLPEMSQENGVITISFLAGERQTIELYGFSPENEEKIRTVINGIDYRKLFKDLKITGLN